MISLRLFDQLEEEEEPVQPAPAINVEQEPHED